MNVCCVLLILCLPFCVCIWLQIHCGSAIVPGTSRSPYYCAPLLCVLNFPRGFAVWHFYEKNEQTSIPWKQKEANSTKTHHPLSPVIRLGLRKPKKERQKASKVGYFHSRSATVRDSFLGPTWFVWCAPLAKSTPSPVFRLGRKNPGKKGGKNAPLSSKKEEGRRTESESSVFTNFRGCGKIVMQCDEGVVRLWCSVMQCVAVCCRVLQCVAVCCSVLQCVAVCCSMHASCVRATWLISVPKASCKETPQ